jgi:hypothetical protein
MQTTRRPRVARRPIVGAAHALHLLLAVVLSLACASAQQVQLAPPSLLGQFDVSAGTLQTLTVPAGSPKSVSVKVVIAGEPRTIDLAMHDVRGPGFQLLERNASGLTPLPTPPCVTYRGFLAEEPTTRVAATVVNGSIEAMIHRAPTGPNVVGQTWVVQPIRRAQPNASAALHIVYRATDSDPLPYQCGTDTTGVQPSTSTAMPDVTVTCEIAIEADRQFYQWNGNSVTQTQNDITNVMNQVDFIFDRDCDVTYSVVTIIVTTTNVYTTNDSGGLLSEFASNWNANNSAIHRDIAHLFTGRNLSGSVIGVAYLSTVCSQTNGYGLSQSDFTNNFNSRVGLTSHELGHNFSAPHCNSNSPCYIMCSGLGGCSNNLTLFSPTASAQISGFASSAPCMPPPPTLPVINSVSPNTVSTFVPGGVTLSGTGFLDVSSYTLGGQTQTTGLTIISDTAMAITMPTATTLGPTTISVTGSLGTSNTVTVSYVLTQPPKLRTTPLIPATGGTAVFDFAGTPNNLWFLVLGLTSTTSPFQGFDLLANPLLLTSGAFSGPLGIQSLPIPVPAGIGPLQFYMQILEANGAAAATGVSNLTVTLLQ